MSMMDWNEYGFDEAKEPVVLPAGSEVMVRIVAAEKKTSDKGNTGFNFRLEIQDDPYAKDVYHYAMLPSKDQTPKLRNETQWRFKMMCDAFGIDLSRPSNPEEDWIAYEAWVLLGIQDDSYGKRNVVKEFIRRK